MTRKPKEQAGHGNPDHAVLLLERRGDRPGLGCDGAHITVPPQLVNSSIRFRGRVNIRRFQGDHRRPLVKSWPVGLR